MKSIIRMQNRFLVFYLLMPFFTNAQGIINTSGTYLTVQGAASIVINDAGFNNDGTFTAGTGSVIFTGSTVTANSFISGSSATAFNNLTLNKTTGGMQLNSSISLSGTLLMQSGDSLYLNNNNIDLGTTGILSGETNSRRITGISGGYIMIANVLNAPSAANPGNLGLEITSAANLGSTVIKRGHQQQSGVSVFRYYDIVPANNTGLNATFNFYYFAAELAGIPEANLAVYSSINSGTNWSLEGEDGINTGLKYVTKSNVSQLDWLTLANILGPLPVKLLYLKAKLNNGQTNIDWATVTETNNHHFEVQRSTDGTNFNLLGIVNGAGNSYTIRYYNYTDALPVTGKNFYRLRQVDIDGQSNYSAVVMVNNETSLHFTIGFKPNPATDKIAVTFNSQNHASCLFQIYNMSGNLISNRIISTAPGENTAEWNVAHLPAGIYVLKAPQITTDSFPFIKH